MPHGKNNKRVNPKKSNKNKREFPNANGSGAKKNRTTTSAVHGRPAHPSGQSDRVSFWSEDASQRQGESKCPRSGAPTGDSSDSLYVLYKKSTQRSKDKLQAMVPSEIFQTDSVNAFMDATDYIVQHDMPVDRELLSDLRFSIRTRKQMASNKYGGGDMGHAYFVAVLEYCWSHLKPLYKSKVAVPLSRSRDSNEPSSQRNQFETLFTDDDIGENSDDEEAWEHEEDLPDKPQPRPVETGPKRLTLQELISGSSRTNVALFLLTLDGIMGSNAALFASLKNASASAQALGYSPNIVVQNLMATSVAVNFSIQQVESLEQMFIRDNPHLNTVYRMFAVLILPLEIERLTMVVTRQSPIASQFTEEHAIEFLADTIECWFRSPVDPLNKSNSLVSKFLARWKFRNDDVVGGGPEKGSCVEMIFSSVHACAALETATDKEQCRLLIEISDILKVKSHAWFRNDYIGKNRSITHTIRLVQMTSCSISLHEGRLEAPKGSFGTDWIDLKKPVSRIQVDMDQLLLSDILPALINLCYEGIMCPDFAYQYELFTGLAHIRTFVKHPERPVSWTLAFTIHAILTGIFETQESNHLTFLAEAARSAFETYIQQLEWAEKTRLPALSRRPPNWEHNVRSLQTLRHLVDPPIERTREQSMLSLWNPYCAGAFLSFVAYLGNLEGGTLTVHCVSQLRMTLHLYNALTRVGAIVPGKINLLDEIFEAFKKSSAIWGDGLPAIGQFQVRWWIAYGMSPAFARERSAATVAESAIGPTKSVSSVKYTRKIIPLDAAQLSTSFRRICLLDSTGVVDTTGTDKPKRQRRKPVYNHIVHVLDTISAMWDDGVLLGTNMICLGYYLNEFYILLFNMLGWMPLVEAYAEDIAADHFGRIGRLDADSWGMSEEKMKYRAMAELFAGRIMAALDAGDTGIAARCADFMDDYFSAIRPEEITWFTPTREN